jgi:hypothetical protein
MASKRSKATKNAFVDRLKAEAIAPTKAILTSPLKGEWTKDTATVPQNMRNDPLSVFVNTMNLWGLMATGWCAIARASWGLD